MMSQYGLALILIIPYVFGETPANKLQANYDPAELLSQIFNTNDTVLARTKNGFVHFENSRKLNLITFDNERLSFTDNNDKRVKFRDDDSEDGNRPIFTDTNKYQESGDGKKKRRKKRKPRQHQYAPQYPGLSPVLRPGVDPGLGLVNSYFGADYYRPNPRPSLASEAVSRITEALSSIALYDDYQCVARLLCEAAGGGSLGTSGLLQTVSGLQPLFTLLSAYNGISSNPLFVFGRAVFLGMSSKGNTASCRYGYPLCPTDPEKLVHYLNNHNGGFFRFFSTPQQGQQNVEQFYSQLSQSFDRPQQNQQQSYGLYNPSLNQNFQQNLYSPSNQYGLIFPYNNVSKIQKRIQNKPQYNYNDLEDNNSKWTFPDEENSNNYNLIYDQANTLDTTSQESFIKKGKALRFPADYVGSYDRDAKGFSFPDNQNSKIYVNDYIAPVNNNNRYVNYFGSNNVPNTLQTVYVVRGNGDPRKPEIFRLKPGESVP